MSENYGKYKTQRNVPKTFDEILCAGDNIVLYDFTFSVSADGIPRWKKRERASEK